MKLYNIAALIAIVAFFGCVQQDATTSCDNEDSVKKQIDATDARGNRPCSVRADCMSGECVPTIAKLVPNSNGMCWSESFNGCALIDFEPWVMDAMCGDLALVVCQSDMTKEMQSNCIDVEDGHAPWEANMRCCDPSFL